MWSRWMSSLFWHQTWRNRLINNSSNQWRQVRFQKLQKKPFNCTEQVIDEQICVLMNGNFCNFSKRTCLHSNGQNSVIYQPNLTSLVSKWRRHLPASSDMLLIGLIWNIAGNIRLLEMNRNFFCWVYYNLLFSI